MTFRLTMALSCFGLRRMKRLLLLPIFFVCFLSYVTRADVRLPALFSDNMVLQQGMSVPVWGWAEDGEDVAVTFRGKTVRAKTKDGKWVVHLGHLKPGEPDALVVQGKNK